MKRQRIAYIGTNGFVTILEAMHGLTSGSAAMHTIVRSAIMLSAWTLTAALLLFPFASGRTGSSGPLGLFAAAAICLLSGVMADGCGMAVARTSPVGAALIGMLVRMFLPLGVCVAIVATGQNGGDHFAFIGYLLTLYMITLGLETWLAVKRTSGQTAASNRHDE